MTEPQEDRQELRVAYDQLCTSYRAIDDFRAKMLGFLPLVTGGGVVLLTGGLDEVREDFFAPVGLFGIAVTVGLLAYELFGIKKCAALIAGGKAMEADLHQPEGQFSRRPDTVFKVVNEPFAAAAIYPAVLAAWVYLALLFVNRLLGTITSVVVAAAGFAGILWYDESLRRQAKSPHPVHSSS
jgi:hypothetical protein